MTTTDMAPPHTGGITVAHRVSAPGARPVPALRGGSGDTGARSADEPTAAPQIAVIDVSELVRTSLPLALTDCTVTAEFTSAASFLEQLPPADVVIFGLQCNTGIARQTYDSEAIARLSRFGYAVCVYTCEGRPALLARCLRAGAAGIVLKTEPLSALSAAITQILAGRTAISERLTAEITGRADEPDLTSRQRQVLSGRARGETFNSIALRLDISVRTAQDHWTAIARRYEDFLRDYSAADLERSLGLDAGPAPLRAR